MVLSRPHILPGALLLGLTLAACNDSNDETPIVSGNGPTAASFPNSAYTLLLGVPVGSLGDARPSVVGTVDSWTISPALPAGLNLNPATGAIEGTPAAASPRGPYTITASGSGLSVSTVIQLGVAQAARQTLMVDAAGNFSVYAVDPLTGRLTPQGSSSSALTGLVGLTASPLAAVSYALATAGSSGTPVLATLGLSAAGQVSVLSEAPVSGGPTEMTLTRDGRTLIVASEDSGAVTSFRVDPLTGIPTQAGSSVTPATDAADVELDPLGRFAWVASRLDRDLITLDVDPSTGELSQSMPPLDLNTSVPAGLAVSPDGQNLYLSADNFDFVVGFAVDDATGSLTAVNNRKVGTDPSELVMHPEGLGLLVLDPTDQRARLLGREVDTGLLAEPDEGFAVGPEPLARFDESGLLLWISDATGNIDSFQVDAVSGALTAGSSVTGIPGVIGVAPISGSGPLQRNLRSLYAVNRESASLTIYSPNSSGALAQVGAGVPTGLDPVALASTPDGSLLAVANSGDASVSLIELDPTGIPVASAAYGPAGPEPTDVAFGPQGKLLYVARASASEVTIFDVDQANLTLVPRDTRVVGGRPERLALSADGRFLLMTDTTGARLLVLRVEDGLFSGPVQEAPTGGIPARPSLLADGRTAFVPLSDVGGVQAFRLDPTSGAPTAEGAPSASGLLGELAIHPSGAFAYGVRPNAADIQIFDLDESAAVLTSRTTAPAGMLPSAIVLGPNGGRLFAADAMGDSVSVFQVRANGGLAPAGTLSTDTGPVGLGVLTEYQ